MKDELGDYVPAKEAATQIGIEYATLFARIRKGKIAGRKVGWSMFIHKDEVKRAKKEQADAVNNKDLEKSSR